MDSTYVVQMSFAGIGLVITVVAIILVCLLPKKQPVQVFVINLLISDLIQLISLILMIIGHLFLFIPLLIGLMVSIGFMVCISLDRYLFIAKPMWYESRRKKVYIVLVCVAVWLLPVLVIAAAILHVILYNSDDDSFFLLLLSFGIFLLLPLPLFIFFVAGTIKAMSEAHSVPADEKRRIVSIVVAILLIYLLLFLPVIILCLTQNISVVGSSLILSSITVSLSPIADSILYGFLRKGLVDKLLASLCFCKMSNNQETVTESNPDETVQVRLDTEASADPLMGVDVMIEKQQ